MAFLLAEKPNGILRAADLPAPIRNPLNSPIRNPSRAEPHLTQLAAPYDTRLCAYMRLVQLCTCYSAACAGVMDKRCQIS